MIRVARDEQRKFNCMPVQSAFQSQLPFQANPATFHQQIISNIEGSRFFHVDIMDKKRIKVDKIEMLSANIKHVTKQRPKCSEF